MDLYLDDTSLSVLISMLLLYTRSRAGHTSLYNISRSTGISIATAYRKIVEVVRWDSS
jgi:hypothetical protein